MKVETYNPRVFDIYTPFIIRYDKKHGYFFGEIPAAISAELPSGAMPDLVVDVYYSGHRMMGVVAQTPNEVKEKVDEFIKHYEIIGKSERKVILVKVSFSSRNIKDRQSKGWSGQHEEQDADIGFKFRIAQERTVGDNKKYIVFDKEQPKIIKIERKLKENNNYETIEEGDVSGDPQDWVCLDWSQETEDFCVKFYSYMEELMKVMQKRMVKPEAFLELVAANTVPRLVSGAPRTPAKTAPEPQPLEARP